MLAPSQEGYCCLVHGHGEESHLRITPKNASCLSIQAASFLRRKGKIVLLYPMSQDTTIVSILVETMCRLWHSYEELWVPHAPMHLYVCILPWTPLTWDPNLEEPS